MKTKQQEIITSFISLTEKIANSKTNILNFGSEDMTFYRGEIHMIKMIGDFPNSHSAELARQLGITRAVVNRTINILEKRELISKTKDQTDKKIFNLNLTPKGKKAYDYHEAYHQTNDQALFDYLNQLSPKQLEGVEGFLAKATDLIDNHA